MSYLYNIGTLVADRLISDDEAIFIKKAFPRIHVSGKEVSFDGDGECGDIEVELSDMIRGLYKEFNLTLHGEIEFFGKYEGGYVVNGEEVCVLGEDEYKIYRAGDDMLISEIRRRGYEVLGPEVFARKVWSREDVAEELEGCGFEPSEGNIDAVINGGGKWSYLSDCTDGERECIREEISFAAKRGELRQKNE